MVLPFCLREAGVFGVGMLGMGRFVGFVSNIRWPESQAYIIYALIGYSMPPTIANSPVISRIQNAHRGFYASLLDASRKRADCPYMPKVPRPFNSPQASST